MAAGSTYTPIATTTVSGSSTTSYTFSSIPSTYTDLVLITNSGVTAGQSLIRVNSDSGSNYSYTWMDGNGTSAGSSRATSRTGLYINWDGETNAIQNTGIFHFMNYANTTTYKTILWRAGDSATSTIANVALWRGSTGSATQAINSITIQSSSGNFIANSTFTLYGILAA